MPKIYTIEDVRKVFESKGYTLISKEYIGANVPLECNCSIHGNFKISFSNLKNHRGCRKCGLERLANMKKLPIKTVRKYVESRGYTLVSKVYKNNTTPILLHCKKHGDFSIGYNNLKKGEGCHKCGLEKMKGSTHPNWNGGSSELVNSMRAFIKPWRLKCMDANNFTCEISGKHGYLNVHHMVNFSTILDITLAELNLPKLKTIGDYTEDQKKMIEVKFIYNNEKLAKPIVMLKSLHKKFHQFCGGTKKPTSFEQLAEFKRLVKEGVISV